MLTVPSNLPSVYLTRKIIGLGPLTLEGSTSLTMLVGEENRSVTYHATEYIYGTPWYDCVWYDCVLVKFDDEKVNDSSINECVSPCRIY